MKPDLLFSHETERIIIGCLFFMETSAHTILETLQENDFHAELHKKVFNICLAIYKDGYQIHFVLFAEYLKKTNSNLDLAETVGYIMEMDGVINQGVEYEALIEIVRDKTTKREAIKATQWLTQELIAKEQSAQEVIEMFQMVHEGLSKHVIIEESSSIGEILQKIDYLNLLEQRHQAIIEGPEAGLVNGIKTGFRELDAMIGGLKNGEFIIIGARPAMGKTTFALNLAHNAALKGYPVGVFSLENTQLSFTEKLIASWLEIENIKLDRGLLSTQERQLIKEKYNDILQHPIRIASPKTDHLHDICAMCRKWKDRYGLRLVIIDYLQLVRSRDRQAREQQVAEVSKRLKQMTLDLDLPVIALSQLNRESANGMDNVPKLTQLRESGSLEQDSDVVMFIHRPDYYDANNKPGVAQIIVAKNRNGDTGQIWLEFKRQHCKFIDRPPVNWDSVHV